jgi:hypothetical protein
MLLTWENLLQRGWCALTAAIFRVQRLGRGYTAEQQADYQAWLQITQLLAAAHGVPADMVSADGLLHLLIVDFTHGKHVLDRSQSASVPHMDVCTSQERFFKLSVSWCSGP